MHLASMLSIAAAASVSVGTTSAIARTPQVAYQRCRHGHLSVAGARGTSLDVTNLRVSWISCKRIAAAVRAGTFEATPGVFAVLDSRVYVRRAGGSAAARGKAALLPLQPRASEVRVPRLRVLLRQVGSQSGSDEKRIAITRAGFARADGWVTPGVFAVRPLAPDHPRVDNATGRPAPAVQQARLSRLHSLSKASDAKFHTAVQRPSYRAGTRVGGQRSRIHNRTALSDRRPKRLNSAALEREHPRRGRRRQSWPRDGSRSIAELAEPSVTPRQASPSGREQTRPVGFADCCSAEPGLRVVPRRGFAECRGAEAEQARGRRDGRFCFARRSTGRGRPSRRRRGLGPGRLLRRRAGCSSPAPPTTLLVLVRPLRQRRGCSVGANVLATEAIVTRHRHLTATR